MTLLTLESAELTNEYSLFKAIYNGELDRANRFCTTTLYASVQVLTTQLLSKFKLFLRPNCHVKTKV